MNLILIGTSYKFSPLELRERISFTPKRLKDGLLFLKEGGILKSAVILSTCNRVEIYANAQDIARAREEIEDFISRFHEIEQERFLPYLYICEGREAIRHLFLVACGLDSLILGETEILGQVRSAFRQAEDVDFIDEFMRRVFSSAFLSARRAHQETKISAGRVSLGSLAVDFIKEKIGTLQGKRVLIIGAGQVTELVLRYLEKEAPAIIILSNRTFKRAEELAGSIGATALRLDNLRKVLSSIDVMITATASPHFVLKKNTFKDAMMRKLLILDLAMPRDVEPQVAQVKGIELYGLEDLRSVIDKNLEEKQREAERAKAIIEIEAERLWIRLTELEPAEAILR